MSTTLGRAITIILTVGWPLLLYGSVEAQPREGLGKISGNVNISLHTEQLSAKLTYDYVATDDQENTVTFYLNENFNVKQVWCRLCQSFDFDRKADRPSLIIKLKKPLSKGRRQAITIEYDGSLKGIYKPDYKFLELGLDNFWYPAHRDTSEFKFTYQLTVKTDERDFQLVSNGRAVKKDGAWLVTSKGPDFDIDLILADGLRIKTYGQGGYNLQIVSKDMADEAASTLLVSMKDALDFYNSTFGSFDPQREVSGVTPTH